MMRENKKARREKNGSSALARWVREYRDWVAGMTRGQKIRHRILQGATLISALIVLGWAVVTFGFQPPELPGLDTTPGNLSSMGNVDLEDWEVEGPDIAKSGRKEGVYTFLVAGLDVMSGATDTMLLLSYDINEKMLYGLNLPRDTIVNVSYNSKRLNTVYTINKGKDKATQVENGMAALKKHVAKLTGITPDYYVLLEWEAIGELVDAIGGVEFEVPFDMDYDDPYQNLHIHQKAGLRLLNGDDAMQVIRHRKNNDGSHSAGDVGRLEIQQDFIKAVVDKCLQPGIFFKLPTLADIFTENVKTDLSVGNILAFAKSAYGMDPETGVSFQTAPLASEARYKGAAMVALSGEGILEIVNNGMNPYLRDIELRDLELIYKKSNGSFGVTSGQLADPKMGGTTTVTATKPATSNKNPKPDNEQPDDTEEKPGSTQEKPGSTQGKPSGTEEKPGSTQEKPNGSEEKPSGSEEKPNGTQEKPSGSEEKPSGTEEKPGNTEEKPSGTEEKPGSTEEKPGSTEEKPSGTEEKPGKDKEQTSEDKPGKNTSAGKSEGTGKKSAAADPENEND